MEEWGKMKKVAPQAAIEMGISQVSPLMSRNAGTGLALGFSVIGVGSMQVEMAKPELFIVLEGAMRVTSGEETLTVSANEMIWFPAGTTIELATSAPCRVIYAILEGQA